MHGLRFLKYFGRARLLLIFGSASMTACGLSSKNEISVNQAGKSQPSKIISVVPIAAKPGETVNVKGENLTDARKLKLSVKLADGTVVNVPLEIKSVKSASFVMPDGAGLGMKVVNLLQGQKSIDSFGLIAEQPDNALPILITEPGNVCAGTRYIDRNGDAQTGTKNCASSGTIPTCSADAQIKCMVDGNLFIAASVATLQAANIKSGVIVGGVQGTVQESPASCLNDGSGNCVVDGVNYKAAKIANFDGAKILLGTTIAGVSGNVTLPAPGKVLTGNTYGVSGTGSTGTLTLPNASNVLSGSGTYGDPGSVVTPTLANQGSWNLTTSFPGAGYYSGTTNAPTAATIATGTTITGVAGSATLSPANCAADGAIGCVAVATYPAALATGAASKVLSGQTLAGVAGNVTLPAAGKVLTGNTYGVSGTGSAGTLTIPAAGNVLSTAPAYGDPGAQLTPSLANQGTWNLTNSFPGAGYYLGVSNSPTASTIATGTTITGVAGAATLSPANCSADGATSCVAVAGFPAANTTGAASKILSGQTLAGVAGNVTLPAVGKVLTGNTYGVSGTGSTGTLTIPAAGNVLSTAPAYGDPGSAVTPSLTNQGSWNLTTSFPGAGYYSGTTNPPSAPTIATGTTITGVAGSATLSPANCSANGQQSCVATGTYFSGTACSVDGSNCFLPAYSVPGLQTKKAIDFATIDSSKMLDSLTVSGITGAVASKGAWNLTLAFPGAGFYTGTTSAPTAAAIATGTTITGVAGSATLSPANCAADGATGCVAVATYPAALATGAASKVLSGQTLAGVAGNVTLPAVGKVLTGNTYGVSGTGSAGTLTIPAAANVLSTAPAYGDPGSAVTPSLANQGSWNLTTAFPGAGYYSGTTNPPSAPTIATGTTITGVAGAATLSPANCSADGATSCVAVAGFPAANTTGAASKILSGQTLAGVAGNVTLPAVGKVLTGNTYGVSGTGSTGTLTIPAAGNVLSTAPAYGDPGAQLTPSLTNQGSWNLTTSFPGAGYYSGTSNTPSAATIAIGSTIIGVTGSGTIESHSNCAADGATGCVAVATYPAALATGAASKILSGQTLAGVSGNVTLPTVGKVLTGNTYGVGGTGSTGTLTIPAAGNVLATAPPFGDAAALTTPTLPTQGTWNVTSAFPGAGYFAGVSNTPASGSYTGTLFGTAGSAALKPADCTADGGTNCVAVAGFPAANTTGAASKILSGQTLAGVAGNVTLPAVGKVLTGNTYGVSGTGSTGTLTIPAAGNVLSTAPAYGDPGAQLTPSLTNQGSWNLTTSFPGAGYYTGTTNPPTAATIAAGTTITGVAGSGTIESHSNCAADGATGCVAVAGFPAANTTGAASKLNGDAHLVGY